MQFVSRHNKNKSVTVGKAVDRYPHQLQLYTDPPTDNISLREFEDFAVERLKVLKAVETVGVRHVKGSKDYNEALTKEFRTLNVQGIMKSITSRHRQPPDETELLERRKDHISHFILRLAYCRSEELRRWFIAQEVDLFRSRFVLESKDSIYKFLKLNNLDYQPISEQEKKDNLSELQAASPRSSSITDYYKVPFTEVLDLVKSRKVYLRSGFAYVPDNELIVIIISVFRSKLSRALAVTCRSLPQLEEDDRLLPMLSGLSKRYLGQDYTNKKALSGNITVEMIDGLSKTSFPLCMQQLHQAFRQNHHLRHWGRMQYGLFLKGIGLSLDEALRFWRTEFLKKMDPDKFDKSYSYTIRHNYGKEGKRTDYTPYSCIKVITTNTPAVGDHHGCPFRHTDPELLKQRLQSQMMSKDVVDEIISLCKTSHYQLACGRYFDWSHKSDTKFNPNHPNQYFEESQHFLSGDRMSQNDKADTQSSQNNVKIVQSQTFSQKSVSTPPPDQTRDEFDFDEDTDIEMQNTEIPEL
ncbi:hypothetical protein LSH36_673g00032 [Paralvinella palmiformis]|uniref:DNA primase large subunit n=1 Tax=Paralvinella palmiformis TaxID=53620 RepID=A0AAD9J3R8_9ANNE|nr:hypothetical protein LSH36_673g00032 [Paralvinella palmiformis]